MRTTRTLIAATAGLMILGSACGGADNAVLSPVEPIGDLEVVVPPAPTAGAPVTVELSIPQPAPEVTQPAPEPQPEPEPEPQPEPEPEPTDPSLVDEFAPTPAPDTSPANGTELVVIAVRYDSFLNFRAEPSIEGAVVDTSTAVSTDEIVSLHEAATGPLGAQWWKVTVDGQEAWARSAHLAVPGAPSDITDEVAEAMGVLMSENLTTLAQSVFESRGYGPTSEMVIVGEPLAFDGAGGFVIIDVLVQLDDSVRGERLRIDAELVQEDGEEVQFVVLESVTRTVLCTRAVDAGTGYCV